MKRLLVICIFWVIAALGLSQGSVSGTFQNPVLHADYSDPDAIRVGADYYMIASSFNHVPGLPILHSTDLVNWNLIGYALQHLLPYEHFSKVQHGGGVWAPAIRFHKGEFYIFYPDPDFGIYMIKAKQITGAWSQPVLVEKGKGLIDPCPLWDDDGKLYLVHAFAGSRAGIKSLLVVKELSADGTRVIGDGKLVYDGHESDPTIEGPKFYKRKGWYYIFAPAGGVSTGWQTVLRSSSVYGPYERKVVMAQGNAPVNGPHQGAWINTITGEDWFLHFQDKDAFGRIVHLQPMSWKNNWPVIGTDSDGDGTGQPVAEYTMPNIGWSKKIPQKTDPQKNLPAKTNQQIAAFDHIIGLEWQWQANPKQHWAYIYQQKIRMYAADLPDSAKNYWNMPALLMQKFPSAEFSATTKLSLHSNTIGERAGLIIFGTDYASVYLENTATGIQVRKAVCLNADKGKPESVQVLKQLTIAAVYIKVAVDKNGYCDFYFSEDGVNFQPAEGRFLAKPGKWVGAKAGIYCSRAAFKNDAGYADFDWFIFKK